MVRLSLKGSKHDSDSKNAVQTGCVDNQINVTNTEKRSPEKEEKSKNKKGFNQSEHPFNKSLLKLKSCPSLKKRMIDDSDIDSSKVCISPTTSHCSEYKLNDIPVSNVSNGELPQRHNKTLPFLEYQNEMNNTMKHANYSMHSYQSNHQANAFHPDLQFLP